MNGSPEPPDEDDVRAIARMLRASGREIARVRDANAASLGLTSSQADALSYIRGHPGCMITDLRTRAGSSHQAARALVERLRERGLVEVTVSDRDARARVLVITPQGILLHDRFVAMGSVTFDALRESFDDAELREFRSMLERLVTGLGLGGTIRG